jgi:hypothetical protein
MTIRSCMLALSLGLFTVGATSVAHATTREGLPHLTAEQIQVVKDAVLRVKSEGLPKPLEEAPDVSYWSQVLVSDAVSVVEVAFVELTQRRFYLSRHNPWTNEMVWYGDFPLDP